MGEKTAVELAIFELGSQQLLATLSSTVLPGRQQQQQPPKQSNLLAWAKKDQDLKGRILRRLGMACGMRGTQWKPVSPCHA